MLTRLNHDCRNCNVICTCRIGAFPILILLSMIIYYLDEVTFLPSLLSFSFNKASPSFLYLDPLLSFLYARFLFIKGRHCYRGPTHFVDSSLLRFE